MKEKLIKITQKLFSYINIALLLVWIFILVAYVVALVVGGETAVNIDSFLAGHVLKKTYMFSVIAAFVAMINMYLSGVKVFTLEIGDRSSKTE